MSKKTVRGPIPPALFYVVYDKTEKVLGDPRIDSLHTPCIVPNPDGNAWKDIVFPATRGVRGLLKAATRHGTEADAQKALDDWVAGKGGSLPAVGPREAPGK